MGATREIPFSFNFIVSTIYKRMSHREAIAAASTLRQVIATEEDLSERSLCSESGVDISLALFLYEQDTRIHSMNQHFWKMCPLSAVCIDYATIDKQQVTTI